MSLLRTIMAILIGFSLAVTPVKIAMAKPMAAMEHCDKKAMGSKDIGSKNTAQKAVVIQAASDCCCDKANACPADSCATKCFKSSCTLPTATKPMGLHRQAYEPSPIAVFALRSWPPPAPPPRA